MSTAPRFMWITPGRILYAGLLGTPSIRRLGGWIVYFADETPLSLAIGARSEAQSGRLGIVPPYVPHRIASSERALCNVILEPERLDVTAAAAPLGELLRRGGAVYGDDDAAAVTLRVELRAARDRLAAGQAAVRAAASATRHGGTPVDAVPLPADDVAFDYLVFGAPLPAPRFDARIAQALARIDAELGPETAGTELAARAGLSLSRFVRLFKEQVGVPLRTYRGWKRARSVLQHVTEPARLTEIALDAGYPDSAHFSRSIRQAFGLQPREVMAGSRRIALLAGAPRRRPRRPARPGRSTRPTRSTGGRRSH